MRRQVFHFRFTMRRRPLAAVRKANKNRTLHEAQCRAANGMHIAAMATLSQGRLNEGESER
jgi:hypothetical protein